MRGCTVERNKRRSSSTRSLDRYLFLIVVEKPHSHRYVDVKGRRTCIAFLERCGNSVFTDSQKCASDTSVIFCFKSILELSSTRASSSCMVVYHRVTLGKRMDFSPTDLLRSLLQNTLQTAHAAPPNAQ